MEDSFLKPELLRQVRARFCNVDSDPMTGKRIYLENAGGGLRLKSVAKVTGELTALPDNAGRENATSHEIDKVMSRAKEDLTLILGARSGVVALGESTTANAFKALGALVVSVPGNNIVTTYLDHPATFDGCHILAKRFGKEARIAPISPTSRVEPEAVAKLVDRDTVALSVIHASNITGMVNDVATIVQAARRKKPGLFVLVDGAQHGPHNLTDVEKIGCDVYLLSSYKLFSKIGGSVAWFSDRASRLPHDRLLGKPETAWELGTREVAAYAAWSAVADYLCWLGAKFTDNADRRAQLAAAMKAISAHERALSDLALDGTKSVAGLLAMKNVKVWGDQSDRGSREAIILFEVNGISSAEIVRRLEKERIRVHNRVRDFYSKHTLTALGVEEGVRLSMGHYNSPKEIVAFLRALQKVTA